VVIYLDIVMNILAFTHSCLDFMKMSLADLEQPPDDDDELDRYYCFCLSMSAASKSSHSIEDADCWSLFNSCYSGSPLTFPDSAVPNVARAVVESPVMEVLY